MSNDRRVPLDASEAASQPHSTRKAATTLVDRLASAPGLVRPGISCWDMRIRLPLHPLAVENAYGDPQLLRALAAEGAAFAQQLGAEVVVGAETGGIPLAAAVSIVSGLAFAFVRKPGYVGHEPGEPLTRGSAVVDRRVLLVDDAVSSGRSVEGFVGQLSRERASVQGVFCLVDMRDVADSVVPLLQTLPIHPIASYLEVLAAATERGVLDPAVHDLAVDAITHHWSNDDPRWALLRPALDPAVHDLAVDAITNRWTNDDPRWAQLRPAVRVTHAARCWASGSDA
jgi:orotate phosphoribosyltransferase